MRSRGHDKSYNVEVADKMLMRAGKLNIEEYDFLSFQQGQPSKAELADQLKERYPGRDYMIIEEINGRTIIRLQDECDTASGQ